MEYATTRDLTREVSSGYPASAAASERYLMAWWMPTQTSPLALDFDLDDGPVRQMILEHHVDPVPGGERVLDVGYGRGAEAELERVASHVQFQQLVRGRLAACAVATDVLARRRRYGDRGEVIDLEDPPGLLVDAERLIAPAEVAGPFPWIQPQVASPG